MAVETIMTTVHTCDLCGAQSTEAELAKLYGNPEKRGYEMHHDRADVCTDCQARPISDLLAWFAAHDDRTTVTVKVRLSGPGSG